MIYDKSIYFFIYLLYFKRAIPNYYKFENIYSVNNKTKSSNPK